MPRCADRATSTTPKTEEPSLICHADRRVAVGQAIRILDAAPNKLTGSFSSTVITGFSGSSFTVVYDRPNGDVWLNAVASVPEPDTWALLGAGGLFVLGAQRRRRLRTSRAT